MIDLFTNDWEFVWYRITPSLVKQFIVYTCLFFIFLERVYLPENVIVGSPVHAFDADFYVLFWAAAVVCHISSCHMLWNFFRFHAHKYPYMYNHEPPFIFHL